MADIRIQKLLADAGYCSRRRAEALIQAGKVKRNGHPVKLGDKASPKDTITVSGEKVLIPRKRTMRYIMLHKPRGYVTTVSDEQGRRTVIDLLHGIDERVYPIGRLDRNSEGLLLLTNDGAFANGIMHPSRHVSKTYRVTVRPAVTEEQLVKLETGVELDGVKTAPAIVHVLHKEPGRVVMEMILHEGKNREIRRMCEALGLEVARLRRTQIGGVKMGMLKQGDWRDLTEKEVKNLLANPLVNGKTI